jgi:outer membrane protein, heavy metal efflux system
MEAPIFDWGQGPIARAEAQASKATRLREAATAEASANLERARRVFENRSSALASFESDVVGRMPALRKMAEEAYRGGQGTILDLLDTFQTSTDARLLEL